MHSYVEGYKGNASFTSCLLMRERHLAFGILEITDPDFCLSLTYV
jgi:hypothetical protein